MSIGDPFGVLGGRPSVPGVLDFPGRAGRGLPGSPFLGPIPQIPGVRIPPGIALGLAEASGVVQPSQVTPNPLFTRLDPRQPATLPFGGIGPRLWDLLSRSQLTPPIDPNYQRNLTTLVNKYVELAPVLGQLPPEVRTFLRNEDARRVERGSPPMTRDQTLRAAETIVTGEQATPEPDPSPWNILRNIGRDVSQLLTAIPRLPAAIYHEGREIANIPERFVQARERGASPLTALFGETPVVRMLPGAFILEHLGRGREGLRTLAAHPVFTTLDVLPYAHGAAASTRVGQAALAARIEALAAPTPGRFAPPYRPISAVVTKRLSDDGQLVNNTVGSMLRQLRTETYTGIQLSRVGGTIPREVARFKGRQDQRLRAIALGDYSPTEAHLSTVEALGARGADMFKRWDKLYPWLTEQGPRAEALRAELHDAMGRYHPDRPTRVGGSEIAAGLIDEYRSFQIATARYTQLHHNLTMFRDEWYDPATARRLTDAEEKVAHARFMGLARGEYLNPRPTITAGELFTFLDSATRFTNAKLSTQATQAMTQVLDAYAITADDLYTLVPAPAPIGGGMGVRGFEDVAPVTSTLARVDPAMTFTRRMSRDEILEVLRRHRPQDRQVILTEAATLHGRRTETTKRLNNLANRRDGPAWLTPVLRDSARSLASRISFDNSTGRMFTPDRIARRARAFEDMHALTAPARWHQMLVDELRARGTKALSMEAELGLGRRLTPDEAAQLITAMETRVWTRLPGIDPELGKTMMKQLDRDVRRMWIRFNDAGFDPMFVHRVGPHRAEQTLYPAVGVVEPKITQVQERVLDLSPELHDLQLSVSHQMKELIEHEYTLEQFDWIGRNFAMTEANVRDLYFDEAVARSRDRPIAGAETFLAQIIDRSYKRFNSDLAGFAWGGTRLSKYDQEMWYIPKALAENLKQVSPRFETISKVFDPLTRLFRYNVIGLSLSLIVNNFVSNAVAQATEVGLRSFRYWPEATRYLRALNKGDVTTAARIVDNPELRAIVGAEQVHMEHLGRKLPWDVSGDGLRIMHGVNAYHAFASSAFSDAVKSGARSVKEGLDAVVRKSLRAQRWGDNVFRTMTFLDRLEHGRRTGLSRTAAEAHAMEMVRQTYVDYAAFTPPERAALRTLIPFYSYSSHAARLVARYPLNHPVRAAVQAQIADAEVDRLGALPGSFLAMMPLWSLGGAHQAFFPLRMFDPFSDSASIFSVAGWMAAANPAIQIALQQGGIIRGERELYPTMRYDPESGRMRPVPPGFLTSALFTVAPRFGAFASVLGFNPDFNELLNRDAAAAQRSLLAQIGIPRVYRDVNVYREQAMGELARGISANEVLNEALRTGDWTEALRYPSLHPLLAQFASLPPRAFETMTPASSGEIAERLAQITGDRS